MQTRAERKVGEVAFVCFRLRSAVFISVRNGFRMNELPYAHHYNSPYD
jgi:hypothetical protein